jgi:hypothetical protein
MVKSDGVAAVAWLDEFARRSENSQTLDHLVAVVDDRIIEALPEFIDPTLRTELHASTRAHWKGFLAVVARESIEVQLLPQISDLARTLARRGFELPLLLSVYRIGQRAVWQYITGVLFDEVADPGVRSAVLLRFWSHVAHWLDCTVEALIVVFTAEREQWQRGALARRTAFVDAVLAQRPVDIDSAAKTLSYPLDEHHIAFTMRVDDDVPEPYVQRILESGARSVSSALGGGQPLIVSSGARSAWCWSARPRPLGFVPEVDCPPSLRMTVGNCHAGLQGFRLSHTEAVAALRVCADQSPRVVRFADIEIACLATGILSSEAREAFVRRELGDLSASEETLRDTLRVYLKHGGDATATAELLRLHPNTVRYRVRQAEKKIGHPIATRRVQIELALEIAGFPSVPP